MKAVHSIMKHLLYLTPTRNLLYVTDETNGYPSRIFEHLSCFLPGLLTLGAHTLPLDPNEKQLQIWAAQGLAYTCWITYADHETGLGPDEMVMDAWQDELDGRWLPHVQAWEAQGRPGGVPPGLKEVPTQPNGFRDYSTRQPGYLLRPEVRDDYGHPSWAMCD